MRPRPIGNGTLTPRVPNWFAALMATLQLRGANNDALIELNDGEWRELLEFCDLAHLTLALAEFRFSGFPEWVDDRLEKNIADNDWRFDRVRDTYVEAQSALQTAGVQHLVVKGFTQAPAFVRDPRHRLQSDLDLYCPQEQIPAAMAALESIGYAPFGKADYYRNADHVPMLCRQGDWQWQGNAYDPDMPLSIELHFCLWNERVSLMAAPEIDQFWERRVTRSIEDFSFPSLHPIDQVAYFALHILRGAISGDWVVHHVREMASFLHGHAQDDEFWTKWTSQHSAAFRGLQAIAFSLAERWFSCNISAAASQQITALPQAQRVWLERCGGALLENMFRHNRDWVWLHMALLDSPAKKKAVFRKAIVPSRVPGKNTPALTINRKRVRSGSNRTVEYAIYVFRRIAIWGSMVPRFLWHGTLLRFTQGSLRGQFWAFLLASFFLT